MTRYFKFGGYLLIAMAAVFLTLSLPAAAADKEITIALTADAVHVDPQQGNELSSNIMFNHFYFNGCWIKKSVCTLERYC